MYFSFPTETPRAGGDVHRFCHCVSKSFNSIQFAFETFCLGLIHLFEKREFIMTSLGSEITEKLSYIKYKNIQKRVVPKHIPLQFQ